MRIQPVPPAAFGRQLTEWRKPLDDDPDLDAAVMRMLGAIDIHCSGNGRRSREKPEPAILSTT
jgi:hypothetical protein